jgi:hypothetical protein
MAAVTTRFLSVWLNTSGSVENNFHADDPFRGGRAELAACDVHPPELVLGDEHALFPPDTKACHLRIRFSTPRLQPAVAGDVLYLWTVSAVYFNSVVQVERRDLDRLLDLEDPAETKVWTEEGVGIPIMRIPERGAVFFLHRLSTVVR